MSLAVDMLLGWNADLAVARNAYTIEQLNDVVGFNRLVKVPRDTRPAGAPALDGWDWGPPWWPIGLHEALVTVEDFDRARAEVGILVVGA